MKVNNNLSKGGWIWIFRINDEQYPNNSDRLKKILILGIENVISSSLDFSDIIKNFLAANTKKKLDFTISHLNICWQHKHLLAGSPPWTVNLCVNWSIVCLLFLKQLMFSFILILGLGQHTV